MSFWACKDGLYFNNKGIYDCRKHPCKGLDLTDCHMCFNREFSRYWRVEFFGFTNTSAPQDTCNCELLNGAWYFSLPPNSSFVCQAHRDGLWGDLDGDGEIDDNIFDACWTVQRVTLSIVSLSGGVRAMDIVLTWLNNARARFQAEIPPELIDSDTNTILCNEMQDFRLPLVSNNAFTCGTRYVGGIQVFDPNVYALISPVAPPDED